MKLLNCENLQIEEFSGPSAPPPYAILSHRWEAGEVTYQEIMNPNLKDLDSKAGWVKIRDACRVSRSKGYNYTWVDTCCINKQDFTELTEAINSMFKWYANAAVCLAYLSDIAPTQSDVASRQPSIVNSLWFTRGWTLQELIAPKLVEFYDEGWNLLGTRADFYVEIQQHTHISEDVLLYKPSKSSGGSIKQILVKIPLARRMSWASKRTTTRKEDIAYSLLGICGINMPLLYGEGKNAFIRLQTEIIKETNDMTLFAWTCKNPKPGQQASPRGVLAASPREFSRAGNYIFTRDIKYNPEYTMTNKGLRLDSQIRIDGNRIQYLSLGCHKDGRDPAEPLGIILHDHGGGVFVRSQPHRLFVVDNDLPVQNIRIYIKKDVDMEEVSLIAAENQQSFREAYQFHVDYEPLEGLVQGRVFPEELWNQQKQQFNVRGLNSFDGFVEFQDPFLKSSFVMACGFTPLNEEWTCIAAGNSDCRDVYHAAITGDIRSMRVLAMGKKQNGSGTILTYTGSSYVYRTTLGGGTTWPYTTSTDPSADRDSNKSTFFTTTQFEEYQTRRGEEKTFHIHLRGLRS